MRRDFPGTTHCHGNGRGLQGPGRFSVRDRVAFTLLGKDSLVFFFSPEVTTFVAAFLL